VLVDYGPLRVVGVFGTSFRATADDKRHAIVLTHFDVAGKGLKPGDTVRFLGGPGSAGHEAHVAAGQAHENDAVVLFSSGLARQDEYGAWHALDTDELTTDALEPPPAQELLSEEDRRSLSAISLAWMEASTSEGESPPAAFPPELLATVSDEIERREEVQADAWLWLRGRRPPFDDIATTTADWTASRDERGRLVKEPFDFYVFAHESEAEGSLRKARIATAVREDGGWRVARLFTDDTREERRGRTIRDTVRHVGWNVLGLQSSGVVVGCFDANLVGPREGDLVEFEARSDRGLLNLTFPGDPGALLQTEYGAFLDVHWERGDPLLAIEGSLRRWTGSGWETLEVLGPWHGDVHWIAGEDAFPALRTAVEQWIRAGSPPLAYDKEPWKLPVAPEALLDSVTGDEARRPTVWEDAPLWLYARRPAWPEWGVSFAAAVRKHPDGLFGPLRFVVARHENGKATDEVRGSVHRIAREPSGWRIAELFPNDARGRLRADNEVLRRGLRTWTRGDEG